MEKKERAFGYEKAPTFFFAPCICVVSRLPHWSRGDTLVGGRARACIVCQRARERRTRGSYPGYDRVQAEEEEEEALVLSFSPRFVMHQVRERKFRRI